MEATDSLLSHILQIMVNNLNNEEKMFDSVDEFFEVFPLTSKTIASITQKDLKLMHKQFKNK